MEFRILGPLEVVDGGRLLDLGPHKQRALLALLLLRVNRVVSTERILEELWGDAAAGKENALWVYISRLRSALEPDRSERGQSRVLRTRDHGYVLEVDEADIDATRFEVAAREGRAALRDDPVAAGVALREALAAWRGAALEDFAYETFAREEASRLEELRLNVVEDRIEADLRAGEDAALVGELEQLVREAPLRERPVALLMRALYAAGRHAEALRAFERFRRHLGDELGVDPSPELRRLEERVLLHDAELQPRRAPAADGGSGATTAQNPYKGLHPFREADAGDFFGRDRLVADVVGRLQRGDRLLALVGPSGSGKSSVVNGGVVPALRRGAVDGSGGWVIAQVVPGSHPFAELEAALLRAVVDGPGGLPRDAWDGDDGLLRAALRVLPAGSRLLLVVDQFEELFTLVDREEVRHRFVANLLTALDDPHGRVTVILTLRADAYHLPLEHAALGSRLTDAVLNVVPLLPDELEAAAEGPAHGAGVELEPALLAELLADVLGQPGALPIFQYALTELFEQRVGDRMTAAAYRAMGGVRGALSRRADDLFVQLDPAQQEAAEQLFLRLVTITDEREWSRRRVLASELLGLDIDAVALQAVIDEFGRHRFLAFDRDLRTAAPTVEVAHEALLREWGRLRDWIEAARQDLRRHRALVGAMAEWTDSGCDEGYLLTGARLAEYERWAATTPLALTSDEQAFLVAAIEHRAEEQQEVTSRVAAEARLRRRARRLRWGLVGAVGLLAAATVPPLLIGDEERPSVAVVGLGAQNIDGLIRDALDAAQRQHDIDVIELTPPLTDPAGELRRLAEEGLDLVVALGGEGSLEARGLMADFPDVEWAFVEPITVDNAEPGPTTVFAEHEGSFLAGVAAASTTRTGVVGFVGGAQLDNLEGFRAGFEAGARATDPSVEVLATYVSAGPGFGVGFARDDLAALAAAGMYEAGADVVFAAAGPAGGGVFEAARDASLASDEHHWVIGVDSNQYFEVDERLRPYVLTSMVKRYDIAVLGLVETFLEGGLEPGTTVLDLADGGLELARSGDFLGAAVRASVERSTADIASGRVVVPVTPTGALAPPPQFEVDVVASVSFDGEQCRYDGPAALASSERVQIDVENRTDRDISVRFAADLGADGMFPTLMVATRASGTNVGYVVVDPIVPTYQVQCVPNLGLGSTPVLGPTIAVERPDR
jgi:basic membrane lipoprotein Med (substrate-binding protein (PBP1-ABC) superfamily)/DNA-binding SARP family transcriptional activator